jgi:hypothetical protein
MLHMLKWSTLLALLGLGSCAPRAPRAAPEDPVAAARELREVTAAGKPLRVLFVGNSYSFGVPEEFARQARAKGRRVRTGRSAEGGWTLAKHAVHEATLRKIRSGRWDVVVLQEQSLLPSRALEQRQREMLPAVRELAGEARRHGAVPVLYQTWGRRDGDEAMPGDDFHAMTRRLREGYLEASREAGGAVVVPAGDFWEWEINQGRGSLLFQEDGSHPSRQGDEVTARAFLQTFYGLPDPALTTPPPSPTP